MRMEDERKGSRMGTGTEQGEGREGVKGKG